MVLPIAIVIIFCLIFLFIAIFDRTAPKGAWLVFLSVLLPFLVWLIIAANMEYDLIETDSVKSFERDGSDYIIYNGILCNLNREFGRDFEEGSEIIIEKYSWWAGGIYWGNLKDNIRIKIEENSK